MPSKYAEIPGWLNFEHVYDEAVQKVPNGGTIVEIGSFLGKSVCYLCERIQESGKQIRVLAVDTWDSSLPVLQQDEFKLPDGMSMLDGWSLNLTNAGVRDMVTAIQGTSWEVAKSIRDRSVDFIFVDGDHSYEGCLKDLTAWFPKIIRGGYIAGHDWWEPGVERAVTEFMNSIWRPFNVDERNKLWVSYAPMRPKSLSKIRNGLTASFVVPTYNNVRYTAQMFASLARTTKKLRYEIIVVDNGSTDETLSFVGSHTPGQLRGRAQGDNPPKQVKLLHNTTPRHLARSWNMGYDAADGEFVFICNNDVIIAPGAIERMIEVADTNDQIGVVVPRAPMDVRWQATPQVVNPYGVKNYPAQIVKNIELVENWQHELPNSVTFLIDNYLPQGGYFFLLKRSAWEKIGRFDEEYHLTGEDWDYFSRLRRYFKIARPDDAYIEHFEHQTCKPLGLEFHERLCENRFLLTEKIEGAKNLFSVIIPVYNRADCLKAAIDSVIAQDFPHWRIYVIDDHSSPAEWAKIEALSRTYESEAGRIWFFHQSENKGPAAARNYGLRLSKGKYVAFLDSDDVWYPNHLSKHYNAHERGNYSFVYSTPDFAWRWWEPSSNYFLHQVDTHPTIDYFGPWDSELFRQKMYIQTSSVSVWGELARSFEFPEELRLAEDWEYLKLLSSENSNCLHLQEKTCRYHIARQPHEADHLVKAALPGLSDDISPVVTPLVIGAPPTGLITVIIPTKNRNKDIERAIESLNGLPFIVVDDGGCSPVELSSIVRRYPAGSLYRVQRSLGQSMARNIAAERVITEWIQFLDDDDIFTSDYSSRMNSVIREGLDVVTFSAFVASPDGLNIDNAIYTSQLAVRRSALMQVGGFDKNCTWAEERDLLARLERIAAKAINLPIPLVIRHQRGGSGNRETATNNVPAPGVLTPRSRHPSRRF